MRYIKIKDIIKILISYIIAFPFYLFRIFPINNKKIAVLCFGGKGYGDNPKYIIDEIINKHFEGDIVWVVRDMETEFPSNIRKVKLHSIKSIYEMATSRIWINNTRMSLYIRKRKEQYYIQTWHGGVALKKIGKDVDPNTVSFSHYYAAQRDAKMTDLLLSNSLFCTNMYHNSFWYSGEILESGSPRNDILINNSSDSKNIKDKLGIHKDTKVILYAPTFRDNGRIDVFDLDCKQIIFNFEKKYKCKFCIIIRLHPNMSSTELNIKFSKSILNGTSYSDMYELLNISDVLITDYSSTMFEFGMLLKPVYLYVKDLDDYTKSRGLYLDIEKLPYVVCKDKESLYNKIQEFNLEDYQEHVHKFNMNLGFCENGTASKTVVERIESIIQSYK
ncbi:CDP-glycerol--glycerophosphate glycerophosphotransferase [Clostridium beijerinckii]|nr:CDP-glycerol--glycerophosphate glycerophosphotransferase [Clostridium beijerinckii]